MSYDDVYAGYVSRINAALADAVKVVGKGGDRLAESMRYSLLAGGKRVRPTLLLAFADDGNGNLPDGAVEFAVAIEMIHAYSLIHDDLPGMDNDDLRRGLPTNHVAFGESTAIVAGDALQSLAFETMMGAAAGLRDPLRGIEAARLVAQAIGYCGMCGGQVMDMENETKMVDLARLLNTCGRKTGVLIGVSCGVGAILGRLSDGQQMSANGYGCDVGMAFQIVDDILDNTADQNLLGKPIGSDNKCGKSTFVTLLGQERSRAFASSFTNDAKRRVGDHPNAEFLMWFADRLAARVY